MAHEEYLRRNLVHAGAVGVEYGIRSAATRLKAMKRPPKWLVKHLDGMVDRAAAAAAECAQWRNAASDAPKPTPAARPAGEEE